MIGLADNGEVDYAVLKSALKTCFVVKRRKFIWFL